MRYRLYVLSPASDGQSIETKHTTLFQKWQTHVQNEHWRLSKIPKVPNRFRGTTGASTNLHNFLDPSINGSISYSLRTEPEAVTNGNDCIEVSFNPTVDSYCSLLSELIPLIIKFFSPVYLELGDETFQDPQVQLDGTIKVGGGRACGGSLYPVFYFGEDHLKRNYGLSVESLVSKLTSEVDSLRIYERGVYVIGSSQILTFEEALKVTQRMEKAIRPKSAFPRWFGLFSNKL